METNLQYLRIHRYHRQHLHCHLFHLNHLSFLKYFFFSWGKKAQKIFGLFDKSQLINLFKLIFEGKEKEVLDLYRSVFEVFDGKIAFTVSILGPFIEMISKRIQLVNKLKILEKK